jgi:hypothetical protein
MKIRKLIRFHQKDEEAKQVLVDLHGNTEEDYFNVKDVPWDGNYQFNPLGGTSDSETPEENFNNMNDIFENLISRERFQKKVFLMKRKGLQAKSKLSKMVNKKEKKKLDPVLTAKATMYKNKMMKSVNEKKIIKELLKMDQEIPVERVRSKPNGFTSPRSPGLMSPRSPKDKQTSVPSSFRRVSPTGSKPHRIFSGPNIELTSMNRINSDESLQDLSSRKVSPSSGKYLLSGNHFETMNRIGSDESIQDSYHEEKDEVRTFIKK